ncbi:hypothetical protein [Nonomuraea jiangxiensis]|uniref:ABC-2 family transporter protein n=1 Tax=Nonomuraea jiangxiensis TaxID=633440 RepID=A0A1G9A9U8_9ACTN|nr:hypothetical protein [Nonomuraea jiangxiensis]SDK24043.1 hypothetical protein SAMN05421869_114317 [Nonomuraea jiangxiensis]
MAELLRAEWTKFRTVRGWVLTVVAAALVTVVPGLLFAAGSHSSCSVGPIEVPCPTPPVGPDGGAVEDRFSFVHQALTGDGGLTVRLTSMTGIITYPPPDHDKIVPGLVPWAKAGIMVKDGTRPGASYAAVLLTGGHGVRMQYDFTHDTAGRPGGVSRRSPRWLRLTRSGDRLTGYESADGRRWTEVGTARLDLPDTVQIGMFANSPGDLTVKQSETGGSIGQKRFTQTTAVFDQVSRQGTWSGTEVGDGPGETDWERYHRANGLVRSGGTFTVTGTGDIAPSRDGPVFEDGLRGVPFGLVVVVVAAVLPIAAEYRRGLIRTTVLAVPRRGRALAAKAAVIGAVTFAAGLAAAAVTAPLGMSLLRANGFVLLPAPLLTQVRVIAGVGAVFALVAVFALALGALFRRAAGAVVAAVALVVLPYMLAVFSPVPDEVSRWLLRLTPAAGLAIQQSVQEYPQVLSHYTPGAGYYPLPPWAGLAVTAGYAGLALALAIRAVRRRDA